MIPALREQFNRNFTPDRYAALLAWLERRCGVPVEFRVAETPIFVPKAMLKVQGRPILAFGNSDGDLAMLRYCLTGDGPRLGLLLHEAHAGGGAVRPDQRGGGGRGAGGVGLHVLTVGGPSAVPALRLR